MKYISTRDVSASPVGVTSAEAIKKGLAPDRGLYMPTEIPSINTDDLKALLGQPFHGGGHRGMLAVRGDDAVADTASLGVYASKDRLIVGLGARGGKHDTAATRPDRRKHRAACGLQDILGLLALCMERGGVAEAGAADLDITGKGSVGDPCGSAVVKIDLGLHH